MRNNFYYNFDSFNLLIYFIHPYHHIIHHLKPTEKELLYIFYNINNIEMNYLTMRLRASYISLIKKHPKGIPNRLERYDKWV